MGQERRTKNDVQKRWKKRIWLLRITCTVWTQDSQSEAFALFFLHIWLAFVVLTQSISIDLWKEPGDRNYCSPFNGTSMKLATFGVLYIVVDAFTPKIIYNITFLKSIRTMRVIIVCVIFWLNGIECMCIVDVEFSGNVRKCCFCHFKWKTNERRKIRLPFSSALETWVIKDKCNE